MKKVFFTAIAMIAFSSVSMANTIADEEVVTEEKKEVVFEKEDKLVKTDCAMVANALIGLHETEGLWDYVITWVTIYNNCESTNTNP